MARTAEAGPPGRREPRAMTQTTGSCTHSTIGRRAGQGRLRLPDRRARPRRLDVRGPCPSPRGVQSVWLQVLGRRGPECPSPLDRPLTGPAACRGSQHRSHVGLRRRGGSDGTAQLRTQLRRVTLQAGPQATTRLRSADLAGDASRPPPKLAHSQALPSSRGGYSGDLGPPRTHAPQPCSRACIPARRPRSPASPRHLHQDLPLGPRPRHGRPH